MAKGGDARMPYVPIMTLRKLGGRISENSYTVVFREVPWRCVRGAWYWDDHVQAWRDSCWEAPENKLF